MDELLAERYRVLFGLYGIGANRATIRLKGMLANWMEQHPEQLRPDAAYFLLLNFDQMIIRPHAGYLPDPHRVHGRPMAPFRELTESNIVERLEVAVRGILESLPEERVQISAHEMMEYVDLKWGELEELFGWG